MTQRDYAAEMRAYVDEHTDDGSPYRSRTAAREIVEKLRANDPTLLMGWLDAQAEHFVWQMINDRDRSRRGHAAATAQPSAFSEAADKFEETGDARELTPWLEKVFVIGDGSRKKLGKLNQVDLNYVADRYASQAARLAMREAFFRALARKLSKDKTVESVYTEDQIQKMWDSLVD